MGESALQTTCVSLTIDQVGPELSLRAAERQWKATGGLGTCQGQCLICIFQLLWKLPNFGLIQGIGSEHLT